MDDVGIQIAEDWEPLAPKEVSDPDDKTQNDWVNDSLMDDPEEEKRNVDYRTKEEKQKKSDLQS